MFVPRGPQHKAAAQRLIVGQQRCGSLKTWLLLFQRRWVVREWRRGCGTTHGG